MFKKQVKVYVDSDYEVKYINIGYHMYMFGIGEKRINPGYGYDFYVFNSDTTIEEMAEKIKRHKEIEQGIIDHETNIVDGINEIVNGSNK